jgi:Fe-S cluster assembly protein SufD
MTSNPAIGSDRNASSGNPRHEVDRFVAAFNLYNGNQLNGQSKRVRSLREAAIESFRALGFPGTKSEAWKYTPIAKAVSADFRIDLSDATNTHVAVNVEALRVPNLESIVVVMIDGVYSTDLSDADFPVGLTVTSLRAAMVEHADIVDAHLGAYCDTKQEAFEALNTAFLRDGVFIHLSEGIELDRPVEVLSLNSGRNRAFSQPRVLVVAEANSRLTLVEQQRSVADADDSAETFGNTVVEISAARHARIDHYRLQLENTGSSHVCTTRIYQREASEVSTFTATLGGKLVRNNLHILPDAEQCLTHLSGIFVGRANQHIDNHTLVDHAKPNCESNELYKGILDDESTGVFNGKVFVRRDAQKTNAYQSNKTVILSDNARMFAKPELEIYADDVKCSHGATTGQLDDEGLFYLQTRGVSRERAKVMMLQAFAGDALQQIRPAAVRAYVEQLVSDRIESAP